MAPLSALHYTNEARAQRELQWFFRKEAGMSDLKQPGAGSPARLCSASLGGLLHSPLLASLLVLTLTVVMPWLALAQGQEYPLLFQRAESAYRSNAFGVAHELFRELAPLAPSQEEALRIRLRIADTRWRIRGGDDPVALMRSRDELRALVGELEAVRGRTWSEGQESLGDLYWSVRQVMNWRVARVHYENALNVWIASRDEVNRGFTVLAKIADPPWRAPESLYGESGNYLSPALLLRYAPVAKTPDEISLIHYLLAQTLAAEGVNPAQIRSEFESALKGGKGARFYDDALFAYGQWEEQQEGGVARSEANSRALPHYLQLTQQFTRQSSPYFLRAEQLVRLITSPELKVIVQDLPPGSSLQYRVQARNVRGVTLTLFRFNPDAVNPADPLVGRALWGVGQKKWFDLTPNEKKTVVKQWSVAGGGKPLTGEEVFREGGALPRGAYVLQAKSGDVVVSEPFFVTDLYLSYKRFPDRLRFFAASYSTGLPIAGVKVRAWEKRSTAIDTNVGRYLGETDVDGVAEIPLKLPAPDTQYLTEQIAADLFEVVGIAKDSNGNGAAVLDPEVFAVRDSGQPWLLRVRLQPETLCPGGTARYQLFVKRADYFHKRHDLVLAEVVHPFQNVALRRSSLLEEFGISRGEFTLSPRWRPGSYRIDFFYTTELGGAKKKMGEQLFTVEEQCSPKQ